MLMLQKHYNGKLNVIVVFIIITVNILLETKNYVITF